MKEPGDSGVPDPTCRLTQLSVLKSLGLISQCFSPLFVSQEAPLPGQPHQGEWSDQPCLMLLSLENQPYWGGEVLFQCKECPLTLTNDAEESIEEIYKVLGLEENCRVQECVGRGYASESCSLS